MNTAPLGERVHRCFGEEQLLDLALGRLPKQAAWDLLADVERCEDCALVLAEAGRAVAQADDPMDATLAGQDRAFEAGQLAAGRYRIIRLIGRGGMGEVYEALDGELSERVALKTIRTGFEQKTTSVERLKQEIKLARRVAHPNVCRVFEFGRHEADAGPSYFLTMQLLGGETLSERLRRQTKLAVDETLGIAEGLCAGLAAIHQQGILHRDIKSQNVMLCPRPDVPPGLTSSPERPVLLDFGIARSLDPKDTPITTQGVIGTPDYMAPEQLRGQPLSPAVDVYALGVVMFELLTGQLPFAANGPAASAHRGIRPPAPGDVARDVPALLDELVAWCLEPSPRERPQSADQLARAVAELRAGTWAGRPREGNHGLASAITKASAKAAPQRVAAGRRLVWLGMAALLLVLFAVAYTGALGARSPTAQVKPSGRAGEHAAKARSLEPSAATIGPSPSPSLAPAPAPAPDAPSLSSRAAPDALESKGPVPGVQPVTGKRARAARDRCAPPYYYDEQGLRVYRKECL
jgi:hypothetical protein